MSQKVNGKKITRDSVTADISKSDIPEFVHIDELDRDIQISKKNIDDVRKYFVGDEIFASVTTIAGLYGENKEHLEQWMSDNDGKNGNPYHKDLMKLKTLRGTIAHAEALNPLCDRELWGEEEQEAQKKLENYVDHRSEFIDTDEYPWEPENIPFLEDYDSPIDWAEQTSEDIKSMLTPMLKNELKEVVAVEKYIYSSKHNIAGQVDLIYRNNDDELVICDLKTSKYVYDKHRIQTTIYSLGYEDLNSEPVDKLQVARASPEKDDYKSELSDETDWYQDDWNDWNNRDELKAVFNELRDVLYNQLS